MNASKALIFENMIKKSKNIYEQHDLSFDNISDVYKYPILQFYRKATNEEITLIELNCKLELFREYISTLVNNIWHDKENKFDFSKFRLLQNFEWNMDISYVMELIPEIKLLHSITPQTDKNTLNYVFDSLWRMKNLEIKVMYTHDNLFFFYDQKTESYYATSYLLCAQCEKCFTPNDRAWSLFETYCGCRDQADDCIGAF